MNEYYNGFYKELSRLDELGNNFSKIQDFLPNLKGDEKKEHIVIKKFENGKGTIDFNRNHKNYKKMIEEAEGDPNMTIKIDSTLKDGKKEIRVEVRKEIHSDH